MSSRKPPPSDFRKILEWLPTRGIQRNILTNEYWGAWSNIHALLLEKREFVLIHGPSILSRGFLS